MDRGSTLVLGMALGIGLVATGLLDGLPAASAATFVVDTTADLADPNPGDGKCGSGQGSCSLRAAIQESDRSSLPNRIELPAGTYKLSVAGPDQSFAATGDLDLVGDITIAGSGRASTVVDGGGVDRVFDVAENANVKISGLTVRGGLAGGGNGGGILNDGRLKLEDVAVSDNRAKADPGNQNGQGGGIRSKTHLSMLNVAVSGNTADGRGGGIANSGFMELMNGTVSGNASLTDDGGGIENDGRLSLLASTVDGNRAANGGGLDNVGGEVQVLDSTFSGNQAGAAGGAIRSSGSLILVNTTISGNSAATGGGGLSSHAGGTADLNNVTIAGNAAGKTGGGVAAEKPQSVALGNTIVAANTAAPGGAPDCAATLASRGYNLIQGAAGCSLTGSPGGDLTDRAAKLGPLAANDGPTQTRALEAGSPAIDAGNPAPATGRDGACAEADQRGVKRPAGGGSGAKPLCDIGAFELQAK